MKSMEPRSKSASALPRTRLSKIVKRPSLLKNLAIPSISTRNIPNNNNSNNNGNNSDSKTDDNLTPVDAKEIEIDFKEEMTEYINQLAEQNCIVTSPDPSNINTNLNSLSIPSQSNNTTITTTNNNNYNDNRFQPLQIVFLFNGHSGGGKAWQFCNELMFNKINVTLVDMYDLSKKEELRKSMSKLISDHSNDDNLVVAICGGDGAMTWAINDLIDRCLKLCKNKCKYPRICCVPCGTGNDLSRVLGWGFIQVARKQSFEYLRDIHFCHKITQRGAVLDRWNVKFEFMEQLKKYKNNEEFIGLSQQEGYNKLFEMNRTKYGQVLPTSFVSYLSFGFDAKIQHMYEQERRSKRGRFTSQNINKLMMIKHGFSEFFIQSEPINNKIKLFVEDEEIKLISNTRSCKVVNIKSAVGGVDFWGSAKSSKSELQDWTPPQCNDGLIEVCCTRGVHSMMAHGANIWHAHRLGQAKNVRLEVLEPPVALQIDGESWLIEDKIALNIYIKDQVPCVAGCQNLPLGISNKHFEQNTYRRERKYFGKQLKQNVYKNVNITTMINTNNKENKDNNNKKENNRKESNKKEITIDLKKDGGRVRRDSEIDTVATTNNSNNTTINDTDSNDKNNKIDDKLEQGDNDNNNNNNSDNKNKNERETEMKSSLDGFSKNSERKAQVTNKLSNLMTNMSFPFVSKK